MKKPIHGWTRAEMARRVADDIPDGAYVNLGIGIPELVAQSVPPGREVVFQTENGLLGMGPAPASGTEDPELINAGKKAVTSIPGAAFFHHADSFAMIRGGHIDICVLGAMQVSADGDLANWSTGEPDAIPAVGGAMDLVAGVKKVFVVTEHTTKTGDPKIVTACTYPLTGKGVVDRIYTNLAVIDVTPEGLAVADLAPGVSLDEVQEKTGADLVDGRGPKAPRSVQLFERALHVLPGGVSRNTVLHRPHPFYAAKGEGCYVTDIEGAKRIDFANNVASLIHGHCHPIIVDAVTRQLHNGTAFTFATEAEVLFAEHMCRRAPGFEKIRFVNSGTEAILCCLKAARAFTGRPKIAKVEGSYHGLYDYAEVSQSAGPSNWGKPEHPLSVPVARGTPQSALDDVVVIPFNNVEAALDLLEENADELACVLVDPLPHRVGLIPASHDFIYQLRNWTSANGSLLVFDEVITFRSEYSGAQQWFVGRPDLTALGKMIGGGFPVGAITGRSDVMEVLNPLAEKVLFPHSGTFSANPITMTAGLAAMKLFDRNAVSQLNTLGEEARQRIAAVIKEADFPACVTGAGSMFRIHLKASCPHDYRESYVGPEESRLMRALLDHLFDNGIMLVGTGTGILSTPMTRHEIDVLAEVLLSGFKKLKGMQGKASDLELAGSKS